MINNEEETVINEVFARKGREKENPNTKADKYCAMAEGKRVRETENSRVSIYSSGATSSTD
eukprot:11213954-Lingulodinium_polyedra.AAC.1